MIIKYIMYNVGDYSLLYNNAVTMVTCKAWHVTHMWKVLV